MDHVNKKEPPPHTICSLCVWVTSMVVYFLFGCCILAVIWFVYVMTDVTSMEAEIERNRRKSYDEICIPYPSPQHVKHAFCQSLGADIDHYNQVDLLSRALFRYMERFGFCGSQGCLAYVGHQYQSLKQEIAIGMFCLCALLAFTAYFFKHYASYLRESNYKHTALPNMRYDHGSFMDLSPRRAYRSLPDIVYTGSPLEQRFLTPREDADEDYRSDTPDLAHGKKYQ